MNNDINEIIFVISMLLSDLHEFSDVGILVYWIFLKHMDVLTSILLKNMIT